MPQYPFEPGWGESLAAGLEAFLKNFYQAQSYKLAQRQYEEQKKQRELEELYKRNEEARKAEIDRLNREYLIKEREKEIKGENILRQALQKLYAGEGIDYESLSDLTKEQQNKFESAYRMYMNEQQLKLQKETGIQKGRTGGGFRTTGGSRGNLNSALTQISKYSNFLTPLHPNYNIFMDLMLKTNSEKEVKDMYSKTVGLLRESNMGDDKDNFYLLAQALINYYRIGGTPLSQTNVIKPIFGPQSPTPVNTADQEAEDFLKKLGF